MTTSTRYKKGDKVRLTGCRYAFDEVGREATVLEDRGYLLRLTFESGLAVDLDDGLDISSGDRPGMPGSAWSYFPEEVEPA